MLQKTAERFFNTKALNLKNLNARAASGSGCFFLAGSRKCFPEAGQGATEFFFRHFKNKGNGKGTNAH